MSAPIDALPNELLEAIVAAGQEERAHGYTFNTVTFKSEWTWSHVSRRFRDVIVGAPALWTLIETNYDVEGTVEIMKLYLERSEQRRISVHLWCLATLKTTRCLVVGRFNLIIPHIKRVWRLRVDVPANPMEILLPFRDVAAPALRHLEIATNDNFPWASIELFSAGAPALTFLKMNRFKPQWPISLGTPFLTHLEFWNGQDWEEENATLLLLASITEQCPLLVHLYLDIDWMNPQMNPNGQRFHIPSLKSLHFSAFEYEDPNYLLEIVDLFDTPTLTKLIFDNARCDQIQELFNATNLPHILPCPYFPLLRQRRPTLVEEVLSPVSQWSLEMITLCPQKDVLWDVCDAIQDKIRSKRQLGRAVPILKLSPTLFSLVQDEWGTDSDEADDYDTDGVEVEMEIFDPAEIITSLDWTAGQRVWSSRTEDIY
ncbi:F-box domain-containing protein [Mycena sanguinolenta]|uniref:F-box domain-containing protein n=1 Tax=Mycena sanguinolenta TaxID=230812 RepID=A0A8H6YAP3_9AGAR|nr:F-box domain-containing protein [Mycena sanguinolenta]